MAVYVTLTKSRVQIMYKGHQFCEIAAILEIVKSLAY